MKVTFTTPVQHDGKRHAEGEVVDLPKADAEALVSAGLAEAGARKTQEPESAPAEEPTGAANSPSEASE